MIAWGSSVLNIPVEDLAWKKSCFVVAILESETPKVLNVLQLPDHC